MKTFKTYLEEAATTPTPVSLFIGRFNPFHNGHKKAIDMMKHRPVVLIVKGTGSSEDKEKNPLDAEYQEKLIKKVFPSIEVRIVKNANLSPIVYHLEKDGTNVVKEVMAGADRIDSYKKQLKDKPAIQFTETPRVTSATKVREAIRSGDLDTFKKLVPSQLHFEWNELQKKMKL